MADLHTFAGNLLNIGSNNHAFQFPQRRAATDLAHTIHKTLSHFRLQVGLSHAGRFRDGQTLTALLLCCRR